MRVTKIGSFSDLWGAGWRFFLSIYIESGSKFWKEGYFQSAHPWACRKGLKALGLLLRNLEIPLFPKLGTLLLGDGNS